MRSAKARPKFMQLPVNITYRGVDKSDAIDQVVKMPPRGRPVGVNIFDVLG